LFSPGLITKTLSPEVKNKDVRRKNRKMNENAYQKYQRGEIDSLDAMDLLLQQARGKPQRRVVPAYVPVSPAQTQTGTDRGGSLEEIERDLVF
jgi:hypothetical protein